MPAQVAEQVGGKQGERCGLNKVPTFAGAVRVRRAGYLGIGTAGRAGREVQVRGRYMDTLPSWGAVTSGGLSLIHI